MMYSQIGVGVAPIWYLMSILIFDSASTIKSCTSLNIPLPVALYWSQALTVVYNVAYIFSKYSFATARNQPEKENIVGSSSHTKN